MWERLTAAIELFWPTPDFQLPGSKAGKIPTMAQIVPEIKKPLDLKFITHYLGENQNIEKPIWAVNSAGECYLHTVEVTGSNPVPPTNI